MTQPTNRNGNSGAPAGYRATWTEIDLDRISSNFLAIRALAGREAAVFPVVKANAYGHGAGPVAKRLESEGATMVCVASPEEGLELRRSGITIPILCLGAVAPHQIAPAARSRILLSLYSPEQLEAFETAARGSGIPVHYHLKVDTGLGRLGILPAEVGLLLDRMRTCRAALLSGVYSNLASADRPGEGSNAVQGDQLRAVAAAVRDAGHDPRPVHLANSAGLLYHPALRFDAVRPGLLLYGVRPGPGDSGPGFVPALALKTTVLRVKVVPEGTPIGYSAGFVTTRESRLATLAIGYDDGLPRSLAGKGEVLIGGHRAPLIGAISMDLAVADVTECGPIEAGAEAVVVGAQGQETIGIQEIAERAGTIPWEIFCGIGRRVSRVYLAGREVIAVSNPLPAVKDVAMGPDSARASDRPKKIAAAERAERESQIVKAPAPPAESSEPAPEEA